MINEETNIVLQLDEVQSGRCRTSMSTRGSGICVGSVVAWGLDCRNSVSLLRDRASASTLCLPATWMALMVMSCLAVKKVRQRMSRGCLAEPLTRA